MSWGLQRAWASAKAGTSNSGVPTYKIRSRHESRIHSFGLDALTGSGGTVCGRENALTCCMGAGPSIFREPAGKSIPLYADGTKGRHVSCAQSRTRARKLE